MEHHNKNNQGFALFMAIIIVGVVISVGLTVLDLTMKQLRLATNSKDSEMAFHAANAGLECARYIRVDNSNDMETGFSLSGSCFGGSVNSSAVTRTVSSGQAYFYENEISWGNKCSQIKTLVMVSTVTATTTINDMNDSALFNGGYPYGSTKHCEPGGRCTVISSRGYSRVCGSINLAGTVQREVLLEL